MLVMDREKVFLLLFVLRGNKGMDYFTTPPNHPFKVAFPTEKPSELSTAFRNRGMGIMKVI